ncbi:protein N-terminal and lysine N-methyltransferase [Physcia stellaris]|nr:protein N-terminal and lysine N-methyltransferase [Physcia stellaris]
MVLLWMGFIESDSSDDAEDPRALVHMASIELFTLNPATLKLTKFKTLVSIMSEVSSDEDHLPVDLFQEPPNYFPPPPPHTFTSYTLASGQILNLRLVGHNPLWGHHVWNAAHSISAYLQTPSNAARLIHSKTTLELGAGAGLPSLVATTLGAQRVVITDYPDADLVDNIRWNVDNCSALTPPQRSAIAPDHRKAGFDTLILADLLFNHHCHAQLVSTIQRTLAPTPSARALVFFSPYRPWLLGADLAFFTLAEEGGLAVEKIGEEVTEKVMFRDDPGVSASSYGRVRTRIQDHGFEVGGTCRLASW